MVEVHPAQAVGLLRAQHAQAIDFDVAQAHAEGQQRRALGAAAAFADLDVQRGDAQRIDHQAAAERGGEMRVSAELARLDARAVGLVGEPLDADQAGERAARADDLELAAAPLAGLLERPLQARLGSEQPDDGTRQRQERDSNEPAKPNEKALQKPYPTEKCRRISPVCSP
jgi:hypothetical protein